MTKHTQILTSTTKRTSPKDAADFHPTNPYVTRALMEILPDVFPNLSMPACSVWEPAAGDGRMSDVLALHFGEVLASDKFEYGRDDIAQHDLLAGSYPIISEVHDLDFIITNPPFNKAEEFFAEVVDIQPKIGLAFLLRSQWRESVRRFEGIFEHRAPDFIYTFSERVPTHRGVVKKLAVVPTMLEWWIWTAPTLCNGKPNAEYIGRWFPPGTKSRLEKDEDYETDK